MATILIAVMATAVISETVPGTEVVSAVAVYVRDVGLAIDPATVPGMVPVPYRLRL